MVAVDARAEVPDLTGIEAAVRWDLDGTVFGKLLDDAWKLRWLPDLAYYLCHAPARTGLRIAERAATARCQSV